MVNELGVEEHVAVSLYAYFLAWAYLTPLIGAYVSDTYLGESFLVQAEAKV